MARTKLSDRLAREAQDAGEGGVGDEAGVGSGAVPLAGVGDEAGVGSGAVPLAEAGDEEVGADDEEVEAGDEEVDAGDEEVEAGDEEVEADDEAVEAIRVSAASLFETMYLASLVVEEGSSSVRQKRGRDDGAAEDRLPPPPETPAMGWCVGSAVEVLFEEDWWEAHVISVNGDILCILYQGPAADSTDDEELLRGSSRLRAPCAKRAHKRTGSCKKRCVCETCGKTFKLACHLASHMRTHLPQQVNDAPPQVDEEPQQVDEAPLQVYDAPQQVNDAPQLRSDAQRRAASDRATADTETCNSPASHRSDSPEQLDRRPSRACAARRSYHDDSSASYHSDSSASGRSDSSASGRSDSSASGRSDSPEQLRRLPSRAYAPRRPLLAATASRDAPPQHGKAA
ncbi:hypothetical protein T484DRAFT_1755342, partial [Baffinella frigidus]